MWYDMTIKRVKARGLQLRVISGSAKGRALRAVPGMNTRPTTDKVKEAIFSMIGPYFDGGIALDLCAGTGGLGIEALSRGAERAIFVDANRRSIETIYDNLSVAGFEDRAEVYRNDAARSLKALHKRGIVLDLVFMDPPYTLKQAGEWADYMDKHSMLHPQAVVVIEHGAEFRYPERIGRLSCYRVAEHAETAVSLYSYSLNEPEELQRGEEQT